MYRFGMSTWVPLFLCPLRNIGTERTETSDLYIQGTLKKCLKAVVGNVPAILRWPYHVLTDSE